MMLGMLAGTGAWGAAQTCTTQAAMAAADRTAISTAAKALAAAVQAGRADEVRALTDTALIGDFGGTEYLVRSTSPRLVGDTLDVVQVYGLDASARKAGDAGNADFTCPLGGTTSEADFSISGLPPGKFAFAMVEAAGGARPWLLAFLLHQDAGTWKMAGFYPHARTAAGHDGLWYWTTARTKVKAGQKWSGWLLYSEADQLLRPSGFMVTTHLDKLRTEQTEGAPPELSNGVSANAPLVITGKGGEFHVTQLTSEASDDGKQVNVMLHMKVDSVGDSTVARARNAAAAAAFVDAHPEVRKDFHSVWVFAEAQGQPPFATEHPMVEVP